MAEPKEHIVPPGVYVSVLIALLVLLLITLCFAFIDVDGFTSSHHLGNGWNTGIALAVAVMKAGLILLFFMHVKYGTKLSSVFAAAGFVWLGIAIVLINVDYFTRNHPPGASPRGEPRYIVPAPPPPTPDKPLPERYPGSNEYYH